MFKIILEKKLISDIKIELPTIITVEGGDLRLVTRDSNDKSKFYLTILKDGITWSDEIYTLDFLRKKIKNKKWKIIDAELKIFN